MSDSDDRLFSDAPWLKWIITPILVVMELVLILNISGDLTPLSFVVLGGVILLIAWFIAVFWVPMDLLFRWDYLSRIFTSTSVHSAIEFTTTKFDASAEDENPINPIYGQSLLFWLREKAAGEIEVSEPVYEDWGWYSYVEWEGRSYMLGASSDDGKTWILQIEKRRTILEKLLRREKFGENDAPWRYFIELIQSEKSFHDISQF